MEVGIWLERLKIFNSFMTAAPALEYSPKKK